MTWITVIVPAYNSESYLSETLESLSFQCLSDLEVIVVDDGSTDSTFRIAEKFCQKDSRFRVIKSDLNMGEAAAINIGWKSSKGKFIGIVSSDDPQRFDWLAKMKEGIELNPRFTHYYPDRIVIDQKGELVSIDQLYDWGRDLLVGKMICIASAGTIINKQILPNSFMPRDEKLIQCSDLGQMLELSKFGQGKRIENVYGVWRQHSSNLSRSKKIEDKVKEFEQLTSTWLTHHSILDESVNLYCQAKVYVLIQKIVWTREQLGIRMGTRQVLTNKGIYFRPIYELIHEVNLKTISSVLLKIILKSSISRLRKIPHKFHSHLE